MSAYPWPALRPYTFSDAPAVSRFQLLNASGVVFGSVPYDPNYPGSKRCAEQTAALLVRAANAEREFGDPDPMRERVTVAEKEADLAHRAAAEMRSERDRYIRRVKRLEAALAEIRRIVK